LIFLEEENAEITDGCLNYVLVFMILQNIRRNLAVQFNDDKWFKFLLNIFSNKPQLQTCSIMKFTIFLLSFGRAIECSIENILEALI
jgi:hypothetical protein